MRLDGRVIQWGVILGVFLVTRLRNLGQIAIFSDEALYLRWAQVMHEQGFWEEPFISLRDGKEPFHPWLLYLAFPLFDDPVIAGRMASVVTGLGTVVFVWLLAGELFGGNREDGLDRQSLSLRDRGNRGSNVALWATLVYVLLPMPLVHDRLAVIDSLLSLTCAMALWGLVRLVRKPSFGRAGVAGLGLGLALLTKSIARVWLPLVVVAPWVLGSNVGKVDWVNMGDRVRTLMIRIIRVGRLGWVGVVLLVAGVVNLPFWLHGDFSKVAGKNAIFLYTVREWMANPVGIIWKNLSLTVRWIVGYYGVPLVLLIGAILIIGVIRVIGGIGGEKKFKIVARWLRWSRERDVRVILWLGLWIAWPVLVDILIAKIYFPRYFLFTSIPVAVVAGYGLHLVNYQFSIINKNNQVVKNILRLAVVVFLLGWPGWLSYRIVKNVEAAPLPVIERWQYLESWPAGYGLKEAVGFLREEAGKGKIVVAMEDIILLTHGLPLYLEGENVEYQIISGSDYQVDQDSEGFKTWTPGVEGDLEYQGISESGYRVDLGMSDVGKRVFLVTTLAQEEPGEYGWVVVREWPKVGGREWLRVWELK